MLLVLNHKLGALLHVKRAYIDIGLQPRYNIGCPQMTSTTLIDKIQRIIKNCDNLTLHTSKGIQQVFFFNMISKILHGFHKMSVQYQGNNRDSSKCFPACLVTAVA